MLDERSKILGAQVREPTQVLLPCRERPVLKRPFIRVDKTYDKFVDRCVRAGLQKLVQRKQVFKVRGRPLLSGVFAVPKDEREDRYISAMVPLNMMCNRRRFQQPVFAMLPRLRGLRVTGKKLLLYKKRTLDTMFTP